MGYATHLGPARFGTVKENAGMNCGDVVLSQSATVAYTDTTAKNLFTLPAGAKILSFIIDVTTAFNSSGTDLLDIGNSTDAALYVSDADVSAQIHSVATLVAANLASVVNIGTSDVTVTATYAQSVADADEGAATITVTYVMRNSDGTSTPTA